MKKIRLLALALVAALVMLGASYAAWSESIQIAGSVRTGDLQWSFIHWGTDDTDKDYNCDPGFANIRQVDKDVAKTLVRALDTDGDGYMDTVEVTIQNAYPAYYSTGFISLKNNGTIPLKIRQPIIDTPSAVSVNWLDHVGTVLNPGIDTTLYYEMRVNESATDNTNYTFTIQIPGAQWNAS